MRDPVVLPLTPTGACSRRDAAVHRPARVPREDRRTTLRASAALAQSPRPSTAPSAMCRSPLRVRRSPRCRRRSDARRDGATLSLQLDTVVVGSLEVGGYDVAAELWRSVPLRRLATSRARPADATYWLFSAGPGIRRRASSTRAAACTAMPPATPTCIEESGVCQLCRGLSGNTYYSCSYGATGTWYGGVNISVATNNTNRCDQSGRRLEQASAPEGRRLAVFPGDGPLSTNGRCGYVSNEGQEKCSALHEYLESKTTTRVFDDIDACLGTDQSAWAWRHDGATSDVTTLSGSSVTARGRERAPPRPSGRRRRPPHGPQSPPGASLTRAAPARPPVGGGEALKVTRVQAPRRRRRSRCGSTPWSMPSPWRYDVAAFTELGASASNTGRRLQQSSAESTLLKQPARSPGESRGSGLRLLPVDAGQQLRRRDERVHRDARALEASTTTRVEDVDACLGSNQVRWPSTAAASAPSRPRVATSFPTPIKVTHATGCTGTLPTLLSLGTPPWAA